MTANQYVEMVYHLTKRSYPEPSLPAGYQSRPLIEATEDALYQCYHAAFEAGDAHFFFEQSAVERRAYFDTLGLDEAIHTPGSSVILQAETGVGFTSVLPYGESNCHISCMCVHPAHQRRGLSTFMLCFAMHAVAQAGYASITLGTDTQMVAFQLYRKHGFKIMENVST